MIDELEAKPNRSISLPWCIPDVRAAKCQLWRTGVEEGKYDQEIYLDRALRWLHSRQHASSALGRRRDLRFRIFLFNVGRNRRRLDGLPLESLVVMTSRFRISK